MSDLPTLEPNFRFTPHMILLTLIISIQYFCKTREMRANLDPDQKKVGERIFWNYIIVIQLAKAADWCLGPYLYEFFERYHRLNIQSGSSMIAISFLSNLFLGPILVGYINDKSDKKFPCLLYGVLMSFSCLLRQIRNPLALLMSQITLGMSSSFLNSCFENWMVSEINNKITDKNVKEITL